MPPQERLSMLSHDPASFFLPLSLNPSLFAQILTFPSFSIPCSSAFSSPLSISCFFHHPFFPHSFFIIFSSSFLRFFSIIHLLVIQFFSFSFLMYPPSFLISIIPLFLPPSLIPFHSLFLFTFSSPFLVPCSFPLLSCFFHFVLNLLTFIKGLNNKVYLPHNHLNLIKAYRSNTNK